MNDSGLRDEHSGIVIKVGRKEKKEERKKEGKEKIIFHKTCYFLFVLLYLRVVGLKNFS